MSVATWGNFAWGKSFWGGAYWPLDIITDRTAADVTSKTNKGYYNTTDLNRVGKAVQYLADLLNSYGYAVAVSPETDWVQTDIPNATQMDAYLTDVAAIKTAFYGAQTLPAAMDNLGFETANNIEKLLVEVEKYIGWMVAGFRKCGTFKSGQGVILP